MTLAELAATLPWGFHDATLLGVESDYANARAAIDLDVLLNGRPLLVRRARVELVGVAYLTIEPPDRRHGIQAPGLIDVRPTSAAQRAGLPPCKAKHQRDSVFVNGWNSFIHLACEAATLTWLGPERRDESG